jgi:hypothetical protein
VVTADEVFGDALEVAFELPEVNQRVPKDESARGALKERARVAKRVILAVARREEHIHRDRVARVRRLTTWWVDDHPVPWRVLFVLVVPTTLWGGVFVIAARHPDWPARIDPLVCTAVVAGFTLLVLAQSYLGEDGRAIARKWVFGSAAVGAVAIAFWGLVVLKWPDWALLAGAAVGVGVLSVRSPVNTALPTPEIVTARDQAVDALSEWQHVVLHDGVLPVLRTEINSKRTVLCTKLNFAETSGLHDSGLLLWHQPTAAGRELAELVRTLGGGSFALAGPRGAGKTSLLRAFCAGAYHKPDQPLDLTVTAAAPVEYVPREFVLHLYAETCRAVLAWSPESGRLPQYYGRLRQLERDAHTGLHNIAYVQTSSGEWSGKAGFRGMELSFKRGHSLAGRPATFPELVADFRSFVRKVSDAVAPSQVVIAIDEIDRLGGGEPALRFLNELKAIFDIPGCSYLVSVSTEAQHDFELSGIGLRSAFDSSFDEVLRVDHLDSVLAGELLKRSIVGLPEQFVALAYVFSGGLPRQLIRAARAIVRQGVGAKLGVVTVQLVRDDLGRVCKTVADALTVLNDREGVATLLRVLVDPQDDLHAFSKAISAVYDGDTVEIKELRDVAAARVLFLAVVRDFFTDELTSVLSEQVDALARARRYAGSNPVTGLQLLEEFTAASARLAPAPPLP